MKIRKILALLLCLSLLMAGCGAKEEAAQQPTGATNSAAQVVEDYAIDTSLGTLHFPAPWAGMLAVEEIEGDDEIIVVFRAVVDGEKYDLFYVSGAENEDTKAHGYLKGPDGVERSIYIDIADLEILEVTEEQREELYIMQEDLNYMIEQMRK